MSSDARRALYPHLPNHFDEQPCSMPLRLAEPLPVLCGVDEPVDQMTVIARGVELGNPVVKERELTVVPPTVPLVRVTVMVAPPAFSRTKKTVEENWNASAPLTSAA